MAGKRRKMSFNQRACNSSLELTSDDAGLISVYRLECVNHGLGFCPAVDRCKYVLMICNHQTGITRVVDEIPAHAGAPFRFPLQTFGGVTFEATLWKCRGLRRPTDGGINGFMVISDKSATVPTRIDTTTTPFPLVSRQPFSLNVERPTWRRVAVSWSIRLVAGLPDRWLVVLSRVDGNSESSCLFFIDGWCSRVEFPLELTAGACYRIRVGALQRPEWNRECSDVIYDGLTEFRADLTLADLQELYGRAANFCSGRAATVAPCNWIYRNRWLEYFEDIFDNHGGVMKVYAKDNSGDPASPINGKLNGLFFMARNVNGRPPPDSPFGEYRIQVPAEVFFSGAPNLYFADFFCMRGRIHYVTLVMTIPGSEADMFCSKCLLLLDDANNPFLFRVNGRLYVNVTKKLEVELFFTENIDICDLVDNFGAELIDNIPIIGKGRSTIGGIPKNPNCRVCNIPRDIGAYERI